MSAMFLPITHVAPIADGTTLTITAAARIARHFEVARRTADSALRWFGKAAPDSSEARVGERTLLNRARGGPS